MQFLIIGKDGTDGKAKERRDAARSAHIALGEKFRLSGNMWYGAALWNDNNEMIGSMLLMDFPSRKELQEWLDKEPYVTGEVWKSVEILKCNVRDPWQFNRPKEFYTERQK
ncbi:MAG TPA: YciI family protein [Candidatus Saccharimonadales bacterium]|nr:YciI family protein [Candidatus Saccharimonadales bacterium]